MAIEQDKTNSAVVATMLAIGAAAMIGGSAAIVALARGEIQEYSEESQGFANLSSVKDLKAEQRGRLASAKVPLTAAKSQVLAELKRDPSSASPPPAATATATAEAATSGTAPVDTAAPAGGTAVPSGSSAPSGAPAASAVAP
jgi:hypothetical protein